MYHVQSVDCWFVQCMYEYAYRAPLSRVPLTYWYCLTKATFDCTHPLYTINIYIDCVQICTKIAIYCKLVHYWCMSLVKRIIHKGHSWWQLLLYHQCVIVVTFSGYPHISWNAHGTWNIPCNLFGVMGLIGMECQNENFHSCVLHDSNRHGLCSEAIFFLFIPCCSNTVQVKYLYL